MMAGTLLIGLGQAARQAWRAPHQAVLSLRLAWWLVLVSLLARVAPLPRVQRFLSLRATSSGATTTTTGFVWRHAGPRAAGGPAPEQLARAIDAILRLDLPILRRGRCWKRALVLQRFLARQGIECRVTFGVRRTSNGALQGHAWLERDGQPLFEPGTDTYAVTFSLAHADTANGGRGRAGRRARLERWSQGKRREPGPGDEARSATGRRS